MKTLYLFFNNVEFVHLGKDVFLFPYYLGKKNNCEVHIVYPQIFNNRDLPLSYRGVFLHPLPCKEREIFFVKTYFYFLVKNARKIDIMMLFHPGGLSERLLLLYKLFNPKGFVLLKLDSNADCIPHIEEIAAKKLNYRIKEKKENIIAKLSNIFVNYVITETKTAYQCILSSKNSHYQFGNKLHLHPNGFDDLLEKEKGILVNSFPQKENLIITVCRLGSPPKNSEMLLRALSRVDLRDWKVILIGPIEYSFQESLDLFYKDNPDKKRNVLFTGNVSDKKTLWNFYNRSKVFCMTSNYEGFPLVISEAFHYCNYLISTPIIACKEMIEENCNGCIVPFDDDEYLSVVIQSIVDNRINIDVYKSDVDKHKYDMSKIVSKICF